ncbi:Protein CBG09484 [Caenorhabditis briggsae]|uniref:Uncharacterized protein n=2 Tax=Caenorhabditis briggsae TaxID=6238 RepID=A0AAE9D101_CAEBR|nr:Protein CBG09484 [Caenorhabditis briggsae]ULT89830.1 hypothetical protein L3Y34_008319 [Caenorhabditis briggsae]CAP29114.2 Protein CBG09484 [Caenorhabditis briggsae]
MNRCVFLALLPLITALPVSVNIDDQAAVNLGAYDRARFDLVETFHPLQPASAVSNDQIAEVRAKAAGVKQNEASISIDLPTQILSGNLARTPERLAFGEWTEWTAWSVCQNGERSRVRTCVSRRPALRVVCHGDAIEIEKCYVDAGEGHIPVAADPWSIEREISGDFA